MNPAIGEGPCPFGEIIKNRHLATLHREGKGRQRAYYLRCDCCGTLQPRAIGGQEIILQLVENGTFKIYQPGTDQDKSVEAVADDAREKATDAIREDRRDIKDDIDQSKKKGMFSFLTEEEDDG